MKEEPPGKNTDLAKQWGFAGTQGNKRVYDLWKKGQATQEEYKDIDRSCTKKESQKLD